mgnify:CR=1 FL=1
MTKPKKKQISVETIESIQITINDLLESNMDQSSKKRLCIVMEKLSKDMKLTHDDYQYLWWSKYGKQEWEVDKDKYLQNLSIGDRINIPQEYITGPEYDGSDSFVSDIQGEWSRIYY